jgi:L-aminopeptidase/D-esterase-like protein
MRGRAGPGLGVSTLPLVAWVLVAGALSVPANAHAQEVAPMSSWGITAVEGLELGHHTLTARPTGCTVILARGGAVGGVDIRGSSPGTRETALLDPVNTVDVVHAVVLSGGSAFGLDAASGVMRYLDERDIGYRVGRRTVPIVVGAILFDLGLEDDERVRPGPECGYAAAAAAGTASPAEGSVGAGAGATVGKLGGGRPMRGGFGTASIRLSNGLAVAAAVAVNAVGDIVDPTTGALVAGARTADGSAFLDARRLLRGGGGAVSAVPGGNTTIGVVATNARLTKAEVTKVAQMAQDGLARTIYPAHTTRDGDTVFSLATGTWADAPDVTVIGALAAEAVAEAILRAVRAATGLPGIPAVADLAQGAR